MVRHCHPVPGNRAGYRNAAIGYRNLLLSQVGFYGRFQAGIIQTGIGFRMGNSAAGYIAQRQSRIGTANIAYQSIRCHLLTAPKVKNIWQHCKIIAPVQQRPPPGQGVKIELYHIISLTFQLHATTLWSGVD